MRAETLCAHDTDIPLPFEIHVTVRRPDLEAFRAACARLGVKPIVLDLQNTQGLSVLGDVMTSSVLHGHNRDALRTSAALAAALTADGFEVVRQKIETVPWHPLAPRSGPDGAPGDMPEGCYFESHIKVRTTPDRFETLGAIARTLNCHRSRNPFKQHPDGTHTVMLTRRVFDGTAEAFQAGVAAVAQALQHAGFEISTPEVEFALWDTKVNHDAVWTGAAA